MNASLTVLMEKHLLGSLTKEESVTLAHAMAEDPAVADYFANLTRMEAGIAFAMKEGARSGLYQRRMERAAEESDSPARSRRFPVKTMAAAAGIAALMGITWRVIESTAPAAAAPVAKKSPGIRDRLRAMAPDGETARPVESAALRRELRSYFIPECNLRSVPVSKALATLESMWQEDQPKDSPSAGFSIPADVRAKWLKPEDEPLVSLEIPGLSMLTSLELIAAQAGLKATATDQGVILAAGTRKDDGRERTLDDPLPAATLTAFLTNVTGEADRTELEITRRNQTESGLTAPGLVTAVRPTWLMPGEKLQRLPDLEINVTIRSESDALNPAYQTIDSLVQAAVESSLRPSPLTSGSPSNTSGGAFPITPSTPLPWEFGEETIDLNVAPEVIDFEDLINYGKPIQTTGINAIGEVDPVVLTDSRITQPVFATRVLRQPPDNFSNLAGLLAAHGFPSAGAEWNAESGVLTARGPVSSLRIASAVAEAIHESASEGFILELKRVEWRDNKIPGTNTATAAPETAATTQLLPPDGAAELLKQPGAVLRESAQTTPSTGTAFELDSRTSVPMPAVPDPAELRIGTRVVASPVKRLRGQAIQATFEVTETQISGREIVDGVAYPTPLTSHMKAPFKFRTGYWLRYDIPAQGEVQATTILVRLKPSQLPR